jgi:hypothetical protein
LNGSTEAIVRDSHDTFVAANNHKIDYVIDAAMAEAIVLRQGLSLGTGMWPCHC